MKKHPTLHDLQVLQPWNNSTYGPEFKRDLRAWKDFEHALGHVMKAAGALWGPIDEADHGNFYWGHATQKQVKDKVADLVICALRMAKVCPSGEFDLGIAVVERIEEKNPGWEAP